MLVSFKIFKAGKPRLVYLNGPIAQKQVPSSTEGIHTPYPSVDNFLEIYFTNVRPETLLPRRKQGDHATAYALYVMFVYNLCLDVCKQFSFLNEVNDENDVKTKDIRWTCQQLVSVVRNIKNGLESRVEMDNCVLNAGNNQSANISILIADLDNMEKELQDDIARIETIQEPGSRERIASARLTVFIDNIIPKCCEAFLRYTNTRNFVTFERDDRLTAPKSEGAQVKAALAWLQVDLAKELERLDKESNKHTRRAARIKSIVKKLIINVVNHISALIFYSRLSGAENSLVTTQNSTTVRTNNLDTFVIVLSMHLSYVYSAFMKCGFERLRTDYKETFEMICRAFIKGMFTKWKLKDKDLPPSTYKNLEELENDIFKKFIQSIDCNSAPPVDQNLNLDLDIMTIAEENKEHPKGVKRVLHEDSGKPKVSRLGMS